MVDTHRNVHILGTVITPAVEDRGPIPCSLVPVITPFPKMKELLRRIVFPFMPDEMYCTAGTLKFRFFNWLYGEYPDAVTGPYREGIDIRNQ